MLGCWVFGLLSNFGGFCFGFSGLSLLGGLNGSVGFVSGVLLFGFCVCRDEWVGRFVLLRC